MNRSTKFIGTVLLLVHAVIGEFTQYYWLPRALNDNGTVAVGCGGSPFTCNPPSICAIDEVTFNHYCCNRRNEDDICWVGSRPCEAGQGQPGGGQQACGASDVRYCCLQGSERCTQQSGQFNICWSSLDNPYAALDVTRVNASYSSLVSANPASATISIASASLLQLTRLPAGTSVTTSAGLSSSTQTDSRSATTSSAPSTSTATTSSTSDGGISGGAIGGIVVGVVGALAIGCGLGYLFWRRQSKKDVPQSANQSYDYSQQPRVMTSVPQQYHEVPANDLQRPVELDPKPGR